MTANRRQVAYTLTPLGDETPAVRGAALGELQRTIVDSSLPARALWAIARAKDVKAIP